MPDRPWSEFAQSMLKVRADLAASLGELANEEEEPMRTPESIDARRARLVLEQNEAHLRMASLEVRELVNLEPLARVELARSLMDAANALQKARTTHALSLNPHPTQSRGTL